MVAATQASRTLTQAIRNFAKSLEGWLTNAMTSFPQEIIRTKVHATHARSPGTPGGKAWSF
ncbi:DNA-binding protein RFX2 [Liparis tanakae]|uniref:DNA-binding protein RFX2 n=1 Tax=Liparis tanakae TaxID=230148 RepID=A0A4Z2E0J2_9TELE|nr:DNA-binding protein RFX2 [Liparis tanakae]